ncbi:MAG: DUF5103 domain-containing protein [Chitinophagales bacterium]|nr:DUF5103 domain-containing protein [Chitinophagales bacterium]
MKRIILLLLLCKGITAAAQLADHIYQPNIHSVKLFKYGDIYSYPVMNLNSGEQFELHFDDLDADVKNYYFSFQLCNADWTPSSLFTFDYTRGFQSQRINTYRNASISFTRYTHYQAMVPDRNSVPTRSGNYLLKVFLNDDTSKLVFTKRFLVVDNKVSLAARMMQPFGGTFFRTHQRVQVTVNTATAKLNIFSPQDIKLQVVQNYSWPTAIYLDRPTIYRGNYFEYSDDALSFPAGREWRWINLSSVRLMSDRMRDLLKSNDRIDVLVKPDGERNQQVYVYYRDNNGLFTIENEDGNNPYWQSDYAYTHFTFVPPGNRAYPGRNIYLFGELTNYAIDDSTKMIFNPEKGVYEKTLFLKQGFYNYSYVTAPEKRRAADPVSFDNTEGNFQATENSYMVLVYFRPFGARADELIGYAKVNSMAGF